VAILAGGLHRARVLGLWSALLLGAGAAALCLIGIVPGSLYSVVAAAVFTVGMTSTGIQRLRPHASAAWDRSPVAIR
jgi:hypothetical protein